jgi:hypothetical protein
LAERIPSLTFSIIQIVPDGLHGVYKSSLGPAVAMLLVAAENTPSVWRLVLGCRIGKQTEGSCSLSTRGNPPRIQSGSLSTPKGDPVQILHLFVGSIQQYYKEIPDLDRYRPDHCPQCKPTCR